MAIKLNKRQADQLRKFSEAFEGAANDLREFLTDVLADWQVEFDARSERWQGSDAGQEAAERISALESWLDEMPEEGGPSIDVEQLT